MTNYPLGLILFILLYITVLITSTIWILGKAYNIRLNKEVERLMLKQAKEYVDMRLKEIKKEYEIKDYQAKVEHRDYLEYREANEKSLSNMVEQFGFMNDKLDFLGRTLRKIELLVPNAVATILDKRQ